MPVRMAVYQVAKQGTLNSRITTMVTIWKVVFHLPRGPAAITFPCPTATWYTAVLTGASVALTLVSAVDYFVRNRSVFATK